MTQLEEVKEKWKFESVTENTLPSIGEIEKFQAEMNLYLPNDLVEYFKQLNGTNGEYTDELYEFYSIHRIKQVKDEFIDWNGIPNYQKLINVEEVMELYVFANYCFNLFAYAIRVGSQKLSKNEVYILCGEDYKKIADTFSGFLDLYLRDSVEMQFNMSD